MSRTPSAQRVADIHSDPFITGQQSPTPGADVRKNPFINDGKPRPQSGPDTSDDPFRTGTSAPQSGANVHHDPFRTGSASRPLSTPRRQDDSTVTHDPFLTSSAGASRSASPVRAVDLNAQSDPFHTTSVGRDEREVMKTTNRTKGRQIQRDPFLTHESSTAEGAPTTNDPFMMRSPAASRKAVPPLDDPPGKDNLYEDPFLTGRRSPEIPPSEREVRSKDKFAHDDEGIYSVKKDPFLTHGYKSLPKLPEPGEPPRHDPEEKHDLPMQPYQGPTPQPVNQEEYIIPVWYLAENNWQNCYMRMAETFHKLTAEFTGIRSTEERTVKATKKERLAHQLYIKSGGRMGHKLEPHTRTAVVVDNFQDLHFPGDNRSWFRGGVANELDDLVYPSTWKHLFNLCLNKPYPEINRAARAFTPRSGRVYQGQLEDFYLVQGMQAVGMKPELLANLFVNCEFSRPSLGMFILRFYKHGQWQHVVVDDALPFDMGGKPLCCQSEFFPDFCWPSLIEKAYAKMNGSWEGLGGGGHVEEVMTDLTGGCSTRYCTTDVAVDRLWQYLHEMQRYCVFGCQIDEMECSKRLVSIGSHWAASIYRVSKVNGIPYICVCVAAPSTMLRHMPVCDVPDPDGYGVHDGFVWLRMDDFVAFFSTIFECRLVNSDLGLAVLTGGIPCTPGYVYGSPWFEDIWAFQGDVTAKNAPSFYIEAPQAPVELLMEVSQTDIRHSDPDTEPMHGRGVQAPLLLRFYQMGNDCSEYSGGETHLVHLSAWGHTRDASTAVKIMRPGRFLALVTVPAKYICDKMLFRIYATRPVISRPVVNHRSWLSLSPCAPLKAMPYSLAGFQRIDSVKDRFPQSFDTDEGKGRPRTVLPHMTDNRSGIEKMLRQGQKEARGLMKHLAENMRKENTGGLHVVGKFGGKDAFATTDADEAGDCSIS